MLGKVHSPIEQLKVNRDINIGKAGGRDIIRKGVAWESAAEVTENIHVYTHILFYMVADLE